MKNYLFVLIALITLTSCDDGKAIVTDFKFDGRSELNICKSGNSTFLFIVNTDPDESISFSIPDRDFDGTLSEENEEEEDGVIRTVELGGENELVYRTYDDQLNGQSYFCSGVPPTEPKITDEYKSKDGGYIDLITLLVDESVDEATNIVTKTYETRVIAHDVTLENKSKDEEIVQETLRLGTYIKTTTSDL